MAKSPLQLQIEQTLREIIEVQEAGSFLTQPGFWERCELNNPNWREAPPDRIYVDGYLTQCNWNSWRTRQLAAEDGLDNVRVFYGYALGGGQWSEHCWCERNGMIIETTGEMVIYYGAALDDAELEGLAKRCQEHDAESAAQGGYWAELPFGRCLWTLDSEKRIPVIGRRVDVETNEAIPGLGLL